MTDAASARVSISKPSKRAKLEGSKLNLPTNDQAGVLYSIFTKPAPRTLDDTPPLLVHINDKSSVASPVPSSSSTSPTGSVGISQPQAGSSRKEPILVDSSPIRLIKAPRFSVTKSRKTLKHDSEPPLPPFPSESHAREPQTSFNALHTAPTRLGRVRMPHPVDGSGLAVIRSLKPVILDHTIRMQTPIDHIGALEDLVKEASGHPAVQRLLDHARGLRTTSTQVTGDCLPFTEKWRPTAADQVLGNEDMSRYLRDWLSALQLEERSFSSSPGPTSNADDDKRQRKSGMSSSKPNVKRVVDRTTRRKRARADSEDEEDTWIAADSEGPYDVMMDEVEDEMLLVSNPHRASSQAPHGAVISSTAQRLSFDDYLANTILLTGPSGSGKTAAVFACAAELGYEVFEVYPGIGRRGGVELERLIGDVGKNHLVNTVDSSSKSAQKLRTRRSPATSSIFDTVVAMSSRNGTTKAAPSFPAQGPAPHLSVGQSIVLLEEADVLYKDDLNFWPTVKNIIKECHRPVIITCNGELLPSFSLIYTTCIRPISCASTRASAPNYTRIQALSNSAGHNIPPSPVPR